MHLSTYPPSTRNQQVAIEAYLYKIRQYHELKLTSIVLNPPPAYKPPKKNFEMFLVLENWISFPRYLLLTPQRKNLLDCLGVKDVTCRTLTCHFCRPGCCEITNIRIVRRAVYPRAQRRVEQITLKLHYN